MPNRVELAIPARSADFGARDAWMVIGFCAIGWLMTISLAASLLGSEALPKEEFADEGTCADESSCH